MKKYRLLLVQVEDPDNPFSPGASVMDIRVGRVVVLGDGDELLTDDDAKIAKGYADAKQVVRDALRSP